MRTSISRLKRLRPKMTLKRTLTRHTYPYRFSPQALRRCAIRVNESGEFDSTKSTFDLLEDDRDPPELSIEVQVKVDLDLLESETGIGRDRIAVLVVEEQPSFRRNLVHHSWVSCSVPGDPARVRIAPMEYGSRKFRVRVVCVLDTVSTTPGIHEARRKGSILSERDFLFRVPTSPSLFNVENTSFLARGWDPKAAWYCEFTGLESVGSAPPEDVVTVHLNKDLPALQLLWTPSATRRPNLRTTAHMVRSLVGTQILIDVFQAVVSKYCSVTRARERELEAEDGSMLALVRGTVKKTLQVDLEDLVDLYEDDPGEISRRLQAATGVGSSLGQNALGDLDAGGEV